MICPECGHKNYDGAKICANCSAKSEARSKLLPPTNSGLKEETRNEPAGTEDNTESPLPEKVEEVVAASPDESGKNEVIASGEPGEVNAVQPDESARPGAGREVLNERYKILGIHHKSKKSIIYKAMDTKTGETVIVKEMEENFPAEQKSKEAAEQFDKVIEDLKRLSHRGLPELIDNFRVGRKYYVVKSFIEGKSLAALMKETHNKWIPQEQMLKWTGQILEILDYLHNLDPPHFFKNINPTNVMVYNNDDIFLVDYDLDRILSSTKDASLQGVPGFMAPEQFNNIADQHSDIYGLGMLIRFLMTGVDPSDQKNRYRRYKRIKDINSKVEKWFDDVVLKMIEKSPKYRPESAKAILEEIDRKRAARQVLMGSPAIASSPSHPPISTVSGAPPGVLPREKRKENGFKVIVGIILVILIVGIPTLIICALIFGPRFLAGQQLKAGIEAYYNKRYRKAEKFLNSARDLDRENPEIYYQLGKVYTARGNYQSAINSYGKALKLNPKFKEKIYRELSGVYYGRGVAFAKKGDFNNAALDFREAFNINPGLLEKSTDPLTPFYRGLCYLRESKVDKAIEQFSQSIKSDKKNPLPYLARAQAYQTKGELFKSKADLDQIVKLDPRRKIEIERIVRRTSNSVREKASRMLDRKEYDKLISYIGQSYHLFEEEAPELKKMVAYAHMKKAVESCPFKRGEKQPIRELNIALPDLDKAIAFEPRLAEAYYHRGNIYLQMDDLRKAETDFKKAVQLDYRRMGRLASKQLRYIYYLNKRGKPIPAEKRLSGAKVKKPVVLKTPSHAGMQRYYVWGYSQSGEYVVEQYGGGAYLLRGQAALPRKRQVWGKKAGGNITINIPIGRGYEVAKKFRAARLEKIKVTHVSTTSKKKVRTYTIKKGSQKIPKVKTQYTTTKKYTLRTESGQTFFIERKVVHGAPIAASSYSRVILKRGKTYFGTIKSGKPGKVELLLGKRYKKRSFKIKGYAKVL